MTQFSKYFSLSCSFCLHFSFQPNSSIYIETREFFSQRKVRFIRQALLSGHQEFSFVLQSQPISILWLNIHHQATESRNYCVFKSQYILKEVQFNQCSSSKLNFSQFLWTTLHPNSKQNPSSTEEYYEMRFLICFN